MNNELMDHVECLHKLIDNQDLIIEKQTELIKRLQTRIISEQTSFAKAFMDDTDDL